MRTLIVLPAYNEGKVISATLDGILKTVKADVLVVDDGSADDTYQVSKEKGVEVVKHTINVGLGASLETGLEYARRRGYDALITFDADGQHNPHDIPLLLEKLKDADLVIGIRAINSHEMPYVKRLGNMGLNLFTRIVFGVTSKDSQSGLRAFNRKAIESIRLRTNRYEVSSEILFEARTKNLKIKEVEVHTIYTLYSKGRGTGVLDGFKILWRMLIHNKVH